jgi:REP element-mobilizing transposase RayT
MSPKPYYEPNSVTPHYKLRYGWAGWPTRGTQFPKDMEHHLSASAIGWEEDGLRLLETSFSPKYVLMTFSVKPDVSPKHFTARVKGRLQYALAKAGLHVKFSRKLAMQSIGENHRENVEAYIANQIANESWVDPRIMEVLAPFTVTNPNVDLSAPTETTSGRYWYNLHLVLVTEGRWRNIEVPWLTKIRDHSFRIAEKKGHGISRLSVMPEHVHFSLRGNIAHSPQEIALAFQNNLAHFLARCRVWRETYYVGTFGEYDMNAVRSWDGRCPFANKTRSPARQAGRGPEEEQNTPLR